MSVGEYWAVVSIAANALWSLVNYIQRWQLRRERALLETMQKTIEQLTKPVEAEHKVCDLCHKITIHHSTENGIVSCASCKAASLTNN